MSSAVAAPVRLVLVRPKHPENIGAVARVIGNTGLAGLRLVQPGDWRTVGAFRMAWGAESILEAAEVFPDLAPALADCRLTAGLSGKGGERIPHLTPRELGAAIAAAGPACRTAVVLGNESSGLTLEERALCQRQVRIPSHPAQPSLNLAQAAMIAAYEIFLARPAAHPKSPMETVDPGPRRATHAESERALVALRDAMLSVGFLDRRNPEARYGEWRELFGRAGLRERETRLLMAFARRVRHAGAGGR